MTDDVSFRKIFREEGIKIDAIQINKRCSVYAFLQELSDQDRKKVFALFTLFWQKRGKLYNTQKLKKLKFACRDCFEFKSTSQLRISFIYLENCSGTLHICLLGGFRKKSDKWPKPEIEKTVRLCKKAREYESNQRRNSCLN